MTTGRAFGWLAAAAVAPLLAHALLDRAVDRTLTDALEDATGEAVLVEDVEVSLLGALRLERVRIGDILTIASLEAKLSLSDLIGGRVEAAEIVVLEPRISVRAGGARLRRVAVRLGERRHRRGSGEHSGASTARSWPNVRVKRGRLHVDAGERGSLAVDGFSARPTKAGLRLVAEASELRAMVAGAPLTVTLGRGAADFSLRSGRFVRAIAAGGEGAWGPLTELSGIELSYGIEGPELARAIARFGGGRLGVRASAEGTEISLASVAASRLGPAVGATLETGRVTGNIGIRREGPGRAALTGSLLLDEVRGTVPWLQRSSIDLASEVAGTAVIDWSDGRSISIPDLHVRRGLATVRLRGAAQMKSEKLSSLVGNLQVSLEPIKCADLAAAIPLELLGPLRGVRLSGAIEGGASLAVAATGARRVNLEVDLAHAGCKVESDAPGADVAALSRGHEHLLPSGRRVRLGAGNAGYTTLASLPRHVAAAFVVAEDGRFYKHRGFDDRQIESSIAKDLEVGRFARGGSTLSQQLAKNLYLTRERTVGRKLQEAVLAWRIEASLTKSQILERYLNVIQLSDSVYGIDAAAQRWFGKSAARLSPREAAFLASLTRAPTSTTRAIAQSGGITPAMIRRLERILVSMRAIGAIDAATLKTAKRARLTFEPVIAAR